MSERIYYDGDCGLCHRAVKIVLHYERTPHYRFAPVHGETFERELPAGFRANVPDSIVVQREDGTHLVKFRAARAILIGIGGPWRLLGYLLWLVPPFLGDILYDFIAANRLRFFERPTTSCPFVPPQKQARFDP